nr:MAG TPA: hypothetical protein [Caudoviricetes sp.]
MYHYSKISLILLLKKPLMGLYQKKLLRKHIV